MRTEVGRPNDRTYNFVSDATHFSFAAGNVPATQFAGGVLLFTSNAGNIALGNSNMGAGALSVNASAGSITGAAVLDGASIALSAGTAVGGTPVTVTTGNIGDNVRPGNVQIISGSSSRAGSVQTGSINAGNVSIETVNGNILIGAGGNANIGSGASRAGSVTLLASPGAGSTTGKIQVGDVVATGADLTSLNNSITTGNVDVTGSFNAISRVSVTTQMIDANNVNIDREFFLRPTPAITTGAIGSVRPVKSLLLVGQPLTVNGSVTGAADSSIQLITNGNAGVTVAGPITATGSSFVNVLSRQGFQFSRINAGSTGTVQIDAQNGAIAQTVDGGANGITAQNVNLGTSASISNSADMSNARVDLFGVSNLTVAARERVALDAQGSTLTRLAITKNASLAAGAGSGPFDLANLAAGQTVVLTDVPSNATLSVNSPNSPLDFSLNYAGGGITLAGAGIVTSGSNVALSSSGPFNGTTGGIRTGGPTGGGAVNVSAGAAITTGAINTTPTGTGTGGPISVSTACSVCNIVVSGDLQTGVSGGSITLNAGFGGSISRAGTFAISSPSTVTAIAGDGDIGSSGAPLLITTPNAVLSARAPNTAGRGLVFATLSGTTALDLRADNGFNVSSSAAFNTLTLNTKGSGTGTPTAGTLNLAAAGQSYAFARPAVDTFGAPVTNTFQVITAAGASPATNATFNALDGDLLVAGGASLTSPNLSLGTLGGTGDVKLQGNAASPLTLSNTTQSFRGPRDLLITGNVNVAGTNQTLSAQRDMTVQARDGRVAITGSVQDISTTTGTMSFLGGSGADESVSVSAGTRQRIFTPANQGGNAVFRAGAGDRSNVTVAFTGPDLIGEEQVIEVAGNVQIAGGAGVNSNATITVATGDQVIRAGNNSDPSNVNIGNIAMTGGSGAGSVARVANTGAGNQQVGEARCNAGVQGCPDFSYLSRNVTVQGGGGIGSLAEIVATGPQHIFSRSGTLSVIGGSGASATAKVESTSAVEQEIGLATYLSRPRYQMAGLVIQGGTGAGAAASVTSPNAQRITASTTITLAGGTGTASSATLTGAAQDIRFGNMTLTAGAANNANALVQSAGAQNIDPGNLSLTGGGGAGATATAQILAGGTQTIGFANAVTLNGGAGADSIARINTPGTQTLSFNSLTLSGGSASGAFAKVDAGGVQSLSGGAVTLNAAGNNATSVANAGAGIEGHSQTLSNGAIALNGGAGVAGSPSDAVIRNLSGSQLVRGSSVTLTGGNHDSTTGILNVGDGTQTVTGTVGISLASDTLAAAQASAPVLIQNTPATVQTVSASSGGIILNNTGAGTVGITSAGSQIFDSRFVGVTTAAGATGNALLTATGTQWIHTANPTGAVQPSVRVAALGSGKASIESGTTQLIEVDYPEVMAPGASRRADLVVGDTGANGTSLVQAVDQSVFAGSITVQSGSGPGSLSKLGATGTQYLSTLPGGISVLSGSGAGSAATIDPTLQSLVANGTIFITGAGGPASILAAGPQTITITNGALNMLGTGPNAQATLVTTSPTQNILASGGRTIGPFASIGAGSATAALTPGGGTANELVRTQETQGQTLRDTEISEDERDRLKRGGQMCR